MILCRYQTRQILHPILMVQGWLLMYPQATCPCRSCCHHMIVCSGSRSYPCCGCSLLYEMIRIWCDVGDTNCTTSTVACRIGFTPTLFVQLRPQGLLTKDRSEVGLLVRLITRLRLKTDMQRARPHPCMKVSSEYRQFLSAHIVRTNG